MFIVSCVFCSHCILVFFVRVRVKLLGFFDLILISSILHPQGKYLGIFLLLSVITVFEIHLQCGCSMHVVLS